MDEKTERDVTIVAHSPIAVAETWWRKWKEERSTEAWLKEHAPIAHAWWRLWRRDVAALELAIEVAESLTAESRDRIVTEHGAAERSAALWYLSELLRYEQRAIAAESAHDAPKVALESIAARRKRLAQLIAEVRAVTAP